MLEKILTVKENDGRIKYMLKSVISRIYEHNISQTGGQLSFFLLLSTFPFLIFLNTLIASFNITPQMIEAFLMPIFPEQIVKLIGSYVEYISTNRSVGLLSIGIIVTVFSASKAVRALDRSLNIAYGMSERRNFFLEIFFSMALILVLGIVVTIMIMFAAFSTDLVDRLAMEMEIPIVFINIVDAWRWVTLAVIMFFAFSMMYKLVPKQKLKFRDVVPGTLFSIVGFMLLTVGFSIYVKYFMSNSALYGTIGSVILLMFWLYIVSMIIVVGAEINGAISAMPEKMRKHR